MKKSEKKCGRLPATSDSIITCQISSHIITCCHALTLWYCVYTCSDVRLLVRTCHIRCGALCCNVKNSVLQCVAVCCSVLQCVAVSHAVVTYVTRPRMQKSSTNGVIPYLLVLPGSELSITEITEYTYFSPLKPCRELMYKSE